MTSAAAGSAAPRGDAKEVFSAFNVFAKGKTTTRRCGAFKVVRATYTGHSTSPEPRLAGSITFRARLLANALGTGVVTGPLTVRDANGKIRMRGELRGVLVKRVNVNGIISGSLQGPGALLLANVSLVFGPDLRSATARLGLRVTSSAAVAYPPLGKCGG